MDYGFGFRVKLEILLCLLSVDVDGFLQHFSTHERVLFLLRKPQYIVPVKRHIALHRVCDKRRITVFVCGELEFEGERYDSAVSGIYGYLKQWCDFSG